MHFVTTNQALDSRRAWFMWALGTLAYVVAVMQRTSFGVAGVAAGERFEAGASIVGLFVVVQLLTYSSLQVPVGVLADRFGPRIMLTSGALLMALGQLSLAFSHDMVSAVVARALVGAGDAMTFTPILRLLPNWFSPRRLPLLTQFMGMTGQIGQLLSAVPFAMVLANFGWEPAFGSASVVGLVVCLLVLAFLRNRPAGETAAAPLQEQGVLREIATIVREPSARLAFWIHWLCAAWPMLFGFMWGFPYLTQGQGLPPQMASGLISLFALSGLPFAPIVGLLSRRAPLQRSNLAFLIVAGAAIPWTAVLLWPGPAPLWLLAILMVGLAMGGPGSAIGLDVARSSIPGHRLGTASGFVVLAGFTACLANVMVVGVVLDLLGGYSPDNFRWAMATQFVFLAIGVWGVLSSRAASRRKGRAQGVRYSSLRSVLAREWRNWMRQWNGFLRHADTTPERPQAGLMLRADDGSDVVVVALVHGLGGKLTAIDVPPEDADEAWWRNRVREYQALLATPEANISFVEVRVPDADEADDVRETIAEVLDADGATLPHVVTVTH